MRRTYLSAGGIAALILLVTMLAPSFAAAADESYAGTYQGYGKGVDKKGKSATSALTFWLEDLGGRTRVTVRVARVGLTVSAEGAERWDGEDTVVVPIDVEMTGVKVKATVTLERDGQAWTLLASGSGKLLRYEGSGDAAAVRTATGVTVPGLGEQIGDALSAIFGGPPDPQPAPKVREEGGKPAPPEPPAQVEQVEEASALAVAEPTPPIPLDDVWAATIAVAILSFIIFGFFVFV